MEEYYIEKWKNVYHMFLNDRDYLNKYNLILKKKYNLIFTERIC